MPGQEILSSQVTYVECLVLVVRPKQTNICKHNDKIGPKVHSH